MRTDHPRAGGENAPILEVSPFSQGSSPRGRGKRHDQEGVGGNIRIIPARAGKTSTDNHCPEVAGDHPRAGGENQRAPRAVDVTGLPPPTAVDAAASSSPQSRSHPPRGKWSRQRLAGIRSGRDRNHGEGARVSPRPSPPSEALTADSQPRLRSRINHARKVLAVRLGVLGLRPFRRCRRGRCGSALAARDRDVVANSLNRDRRAVPCLP